MKNKQLKSFKDLSVWQKASGLATLIYKITEDFPRSELYGITNQMRRAAVSISSNIAEGFKRNHKGEKSQFYNIAYGSVAELESQLEVARNLNFLSEENYQNITLLITEVSKMMNGLIKSLNSRSPLNPQSSILNSERGFTIIELLVAMGIFVIVISIAIGGFVQALRTERQTTALINANNNMSLVLEQMMREIRTGYNFCASGLSQPCDQSQFSFINANGQQVVYMLGSGSGDTPTSTIIYRGADGNYQPLTAPDVNVDSLNFYYGSCTDPNSPDSGGYCSTGQNRPNFITFSIGISPKGLPITIYLQTSVSSRIL